MTPTNPTPSELSDEELIASLRGLQRHIERAPNWFDIVEYHRQTLLVLQNLQRITSLAADGMLARRERAAR